MKENRLESVQAKADEGAHIALATDQQAGPGDGRLEPGRHVVQLRAGIGWKRGDLLGHEIGADQQVVWWRWLGADVTRGSIHQRGTLPYPCVIDQAFCVRPGTSISSLPGPVRALPAGD